MLDAKNIVFVGAHPDDIEVGCGGSIKNFVESGKNVFYIIGSKGEKTGDPQIRLQELYDASNKVGIKRENIFLLNLEDSMISDGPSTISMVEDILKQITPEIIFVTPPHDRHQDHRNISNAVIVASRNLKCSILFYETVSSSNSFMPKVFIDISRAFNDKITSVKSYKNINESIIDFITTMAKFRGHQSKVSYAEGFEVGKIISSL